MTTGSPAITMSNLNMLKHFDQTWLHAHVYVQKRARAARPRACGALHAQRAAAGVAQPEAAIRCGP
jgi:hypothetical protein